MTPAHSPVSVVIPAYNEEDYIGNVLDVLCGVDEVASILVVDDGSTDSTVAVVQRFAARDARVRLLSLEHNLGKGGAMVAGADYVAQDLILFLDADLLGLRPDHIRSLIGPVVRGDCDMTLGLFTGGRVQTDASHKLTPFLSGQRCLRWSLFRDAPEIGQARWGVEVALSLYAWRYGLRVGRIHCVWHDPCHARREDERHCGILVPCPNVVGYCALLFALFCLSTFLGPPTAARYPTHAPTCVARSKGILRARPLIALTMVNRAAQSQAASLWLCRSG